MPKNSQTYFLHGTLAASEINTLAASEINTLGYPQAALFGFCVALVAYNALAVVFAALRAVHETQTIDHEVSGYYIANEIAETHRGMIIAIPEEHWQIFATMFAVVFAATSLQLAHKVHLRAFRKHPRGPKKPSPRRHSSTQQLHVSTARLRRQQRAQSGTPFKRRICWIDQLYVHPCHDVC